MKPSHLIQSLFVLCLISSQALLAGESLQVLPTRVVFEKTRSAELTLANKGDQAGQYRILLRNLRTDETGAFSHAESEQEGERFAESMIRFSPRSVSIEPSGFQKVRLMIRKPKELEDGEYRTHMVFQSVPPEVPSVLDDSQKVEVSVKPIVELTIPIIIRHGALTASASLQSPNFSDGNVIFELHREGNRSLYGDVGIYKEKAGGLGQQVGFIKGISVYVPNAMRRLTVPVQLKSKPDQPLVVQFHEDPNYGGQETAQISF